MGFGDDEDKNELLVDKFKKFRIYTFRRKNLKEIKEMECSIGSCENPALVLKNEYGSGYSHFRFCIKHILMFSSKIEIENDKLKIYKGQISSVR